MTKTLFMLISALILSVFLFSMVSAYYYPDHSYGNTRDTVTTDRTSTQVIHHPYGTERKTIHVTETSRINNFLPGYYPTPQYYSPNFVPYTKPTSFRNLPAYNSYNYQRSNWYNDNQANYPDSYYYQPRYDSYQGNYNWRY